MRLMTVWRITGKIIRTAITLTYAHQIMASAYSFTFRSFLCFSVKVNLSVPLLCVCAILPGKGE